MANRSYLYSINEVPVRGKKMTGRIRGISECSFLSPIPLSHLILVSSGTRQVRSLIWDGEDDTAIMGDYAKGLKKFESIRDRLTADSGKQVMQEAIDFLRNSKRRGKYFYLELGELLEMKKKPFMKQMREYLKIVADVDEVIDEVIKKINADEKRAEAKQKKSTSGKNGPKVVAKNPHDLFVVCGFLEWSDDLYYNLNQSGRSPKKQ